MADTDPPDPGSEQMYASRGDSSCPHLGRSDDADSYYSFPTSANCCHVVELPLAIEPSYQDSVCLGQNWRACPRYEAALAGDEIRPSTTVSRLRRLANRAPPAWSIVGVVVVVGMILGGLVLVLRLQSPGTKPSRAASDLATTESDPASAAEPTAFSSHGLALTPAPIGESPVALLQPVITPSSSEPSSAGGGRTPMPMLGTVSAQTTTTTSSRTPARTAVPTPTPVPPWTPSPAPPPTPRSTATRRATAIPTSTPTRMPSPRPEPTTFSPRATRQPTATIARLPAPSLLTPSERQDFSEGSEVVLAWQLVGELPPDAHFVITVAYAHLGATWHDEVPWTRETSWILSEHSYLLDLSDDGQYQWSVQVVQQTGVGANGQPIGVPLSPPSDVRTLLWRRAGGGGGEAPENTPPVPPP